MQFFVMLMILAIMVAVPEVSAAATRSPGGPVLTLREAFQKAWKENASLKMSRVQELIAEQDRIRARAGFLPTVKAHTLQQIYDAPRKYVFGQNPPFSFMNRNYWESTVTAEQTLFDFGATPSRYRQAVIGKEVAKLDTQTTRDEVFFLVAQTYFQVLRAQKLQIIADQEVSQLQDHLKTAKDLYEFGVVTYNDVLQAEVALADARQRLIAAKNFVVNTQAALNKLIGEPIHQLYGLQEEDITDIPKGAGLEEVTATALQSRSELKAAEGRRQQGEKSITEARAGYFPRFYAMGGQYYQQSRYALHENQWFAILGLNWKIFSGFDTKAQVAQARERLQQLEIQKKDLAEQIKLEVQNAYLGLQETAARITVTKGAVKQGEENLRLNQERYKEQVGTATDVIDAQTLLTRIRVNYNNAVYDHQVQKAQFLRAIGKISDLAPVPQPLSGQ
ncbi:MAG: TolC family protein [Desulfobacca sp.]|uniref:TolC family protein n=1 Tax=Desulfobacca sp. TaxID=2067990 RepID=UPI0040498733